ncbi:MAG: hypothetical protein ACFBSF_09710 [Leptolyngbyaceae cyanobacterium]
MNKPSGDIIQPGRDFNQVGRDIVHGHVFNIDDFQLIFNLVNDIIENTNTIVQTVENLEVEISNSNQFENSESNQFRVSESNEIFESDLEVIRESSEEIVTLSQSVNRQLNEFSQSYHCQASEITVSDPETSAPVPPSESGTSPDDTLTSRQSTRQSPARGDSEKQPPTTDAESLAQEENPDCANVATNGSCYWLGQEGSEYW